MLRSELIKKISEENPKLPREVVEAAIQTFFDTITEALSQGRRVELRSFGCFVLKRYEERIARNPKTGQPVQVPSKRLPTFRAGKLIFARINSEPGAL